MQKIESSPTENTFQSNDSAQSVILHTHRDTGFPHIKLMLPRTKDVLSFPLKSPSCKQVSNKYRDNCSLTQYGNFNLTQNLAGTEAEATHFKGKLPDPSWCEYLMF